MNLRPTGTFLDAIRAESEWRKQFGSVETREQAQAAYAKYSAWLDTPEATAEILRDPWKAQLAFDIENIDQLSRTKALLARLKTGNF